MRDEEIEARFQEIIDNTHIKTSQEEPILDPATLSECVLEISEVNAYLTRLLSNVIDDPDILFRLDEEIVMMILELAGLSEALSDTLTTCHCKGCQPDCDCGPDETCEECE